MKASATRPMPMPSSTGLSTMPIALISSATACDELDRDQLPRIDHPIRHLAKTNCQQDAAQAGDIMSEHRAT